MTELYIVSVRERATLAPVANGPICLGIMV